MPQLSAGQTASIILAPADSYTVSASATTTVKGIYGAPSTTTTLTANFQTFGPYSVPAKLDISCASGTATYSLNAVRGAVFDQESTPPGSLIVIAAAAPSNADGRPDGTIYIQTV